LLILYNRPDSFAYSILNLDRHVSTCKTIRRTRWSYHSPNQSARAISQWRARCFSGIG
jgi:hypothetical protein